MKNLKNRPLKFEKKLNKSQLIPSEDLNKIKGGLVIDPITSTLIQFGAGYVAGKISNWFNGD